MSSTASLVFVTVGKEEEAKIIARKLVEESLAACVGIIPQSSIYSWKGEIVEDNEVLLIIKTSNEMFIPLRDRILSIHSYEVPEIIRIDIQEGHEPYLRWIEETVQKPD
ncbi:MAG: divalent-cation tolerance protein CutA [Promethearchaeota archaeon]